MVHNLYRFVTYLMKAKYNFFTLSMKWRRKEWKLERI
nr:MAG TPA: hypothetical protein [Caudoviricetes sp.]